jgi:LysM repeat protein
MDQKQRLNTRTLLALAGIGAFCAVTIFIAIAILFIRANDQQNASPTSVAVVVGGQTVILYPNPDMSVRIVSGQPESAGDAATATAIATAQIGTGGQESATPVPIATLPAPLPTPTPWPPSVIFTNYVVVAGDTLYRLTQKYNTSIDLMARYNIAADSIIVGNTLLLPIANPAFCPGSQPHVVRDQQTVSEIARAYSTTPQAIAAINGLDASYSVKTTQVLCVPY